MSVSNGIISAPVSISDVATCLGVGSYDLGTLWKSKKINKWALYKPVIWNSVDVNLTNREWYKGEDGLCGLSIPWCLSQYLDRLMPEIVLEYGIGEVEWNYLVPNDLSSTYRRLLDFEGYNHKAISPFYEKMVGGSYIVDDKLYPEVVAINNNSYNIQGNLSLDKLSVNGLSCANFYAGILIVDEDGNLCWISSSNNKLSSKLDNYICYFYTSSMEKGTYYIYGIMSSINLYGANSIDFLRGDTLPSCTIALLNLAPGILYIGGSREVYIYFEIEVKKANDGVNHIVSQNLVGINKTGQDVTINSFTLKEQYYTDRGDWLTMLEDTIELDTILPADSTSPYEFRYGGSFVAEKTSWFVQNADKYRSYLETAETTYAAFATEYQLSVGSYG